MSSDQKLVVVIPTYNASLTIVETLRSLVGQQNVGEMRVIITDDASKDNTIAVAEKFCRGQALIVKYGFLRGMAASELR